MKVCPEMREMMKTTQQIQNMGGQEGNEMDTTDFKTFSFEQKLFKV